MSILDYSLCSDPGCPYQLIAKKATAANDWVVPTTVLCFKQLTRGLGGCCDSLRLPLQALLSCSDIVLL